MYCWPGSASIRRRATHDGRGHARSSHGQKGLSGQAALFALCGTQLSHASILWRYTHTYFFLDGCGRVRLPAGTERRLPFRKGEEVTASSGQRAKLSRPLDFMVVADHSDGFGFFPQLLSGDPGLLATPQGRKWYDMINSGKGAQAAVDIITSFGKGRLPKGFPCPARRLSRGLGRKSLKPRMRRMSRASFTAFIGYEWTSNTGATTFIATSSFARRAEGEPDRTLHHATAARQ